MHTTKSHNTRVPWRVAAAAVSGLTSIPFRRTLKKQQHLCIDFLQGKIDELKHVALKAGADNYVVKQIIDRQY